MDSWEDKATGQKRSRLRVVGENIQFLDRREGGPTGADEQHGSHGGGGMSSPPQQSSRPPQQKSYGNGPSQRPPVRQSGPPDDFGDGPITDGLDDDDIPF
jgi:single-strand DNA-binding protein